MAQKAHSKIPRLLFGMIAIPLAAIGAECWYSPRVGGLMLETGLLVIGSCALSVPLAISLALMIGRTNIVAAPAARVTVILGIILPLPLLAAAWISAFDSQGWAGEIGAEFFARGRLPAVVIHAVAATSWTTTILLASLCTLSQELEEEGRLFLSPLRVLRHITLPQLTLPLVVGVTWTTLTCCTEIAITDFFQVRSLAEEIYTQSTLGDLSATSWLPGGATTSQPAGNQPGTHAAAEIGPVIRISLLIAAMFALGWHQLAKRFHHIYDVPSTFVTYRLPLGRLRVPISMATWLVAGALLAIPVISLLITLGRQVTWQGEQRIVSWSMSKASDLLARAPWEHRRELVYSLRLAFLAALASTTWAILSLWASRRCRLAQPVALLPLALALLPAPLLGVFCIAILNQPLDSPFRCLTWLYDHTIFAPALVQSIRAYPVALLLSYFALSTLPQGLFQAATLERAGHWQQFFFIALPQRRAAFSAIFLLAYASALTELPATLLVLPPGPTTLTVRLFQLTHYGADDRVAALCLLILLIGLIFAVVIGVLWERASRSAVRKRPDSPE